MNRPLFALLILGLALPVGAQEPPPIEGGIFCMLWHDSPNDRKALAGVRRGLEALGLADHMNVINVDGDAKRAGKLLDAWDAGAATAVIAFGTKSARLAARHVKKVPVVFTAVTHPVLSGIVPSWKGSGRNIAGNSNWLDRREMLSAFRLAVPGLRRVLMLQSPDNPVSDAEFREARSVAAESGLTIIRRKVKAGEAEAIDASLADLDGVDALWIPIDFDLYQEKPLRRIVRLAAARKIPVVSSAEKCAGEGALVVVTVDYEVLGLKATSILRRILKKKVAPKDIPVGRLTGSRIYVDLDAARRIGLEPPLDLVLRAFKVFGAGSKERKN